MATLVDLRLSVTILVADYTNPDKLTNDFLILNILGSTLKTDTKA